jgi:hypothetical protein
MPRNRWIGAVLFASWLLLAECTSTSGMNCQAVGGKTVCIKLETTPFLQLNVPIVQTVTVMAPNEDIDDVIVQMATNAPSYAVLEGETTWTVDLKQGVPVTLGASLRVSEYGYYYTSALAGPTGYTPVGTTVDYDLQP